MNISEVITNDSNRKQIIDFEMGNLHTFELKDYIDFYSEVHHLQVEILNLICDRAILLPLFGVTSVVFKNCEIGNVYYSNTVRYIDVYMEKSYIRKYNRRIPISKPIENLKVTNKSIFSSSVISNMYLNSISM